MQRLAKFIYFNLLGWSFDGTMPDLQKCVIIIAPHTSWVDYPLGLLVRTVLKVEVHYVAKKSLFRPPFGWFFRWMNGTPIDRSKVNDSVRAITLLFRERATFRLALSPEGTRRKVSRWKTGFYYIAFSAGVPIVLVALDYGRKQVRISGPHIPTGSIESDMAYYMEFYTNVRGRHAHLGF